jgi:hypothetical protein
MRIVRKSQGNCERKDVWPRLIRAAGSLGRSAQFGQPTFALQLNSCIGFMMAGYMLEFLRCSGFRCLCDCLGIAPAKACLRRRPTRATEPAAGDGFLNRSIELNGVRLPLPGLPARRVAARRPQAVADDSVSARARRARFRGHVADADRLPQAVRDHPERWPFVIVMPQCPLPNYWTDPEMLAMAMAALDQETAEFHGDPERTYLTGLSLGGYGAWELARLHPNAGRRWPLRPAASSGAMPRSAGRRHSRCPPSTPARWAARRSGSSTEPTTTWCRRARAS